ncbi:MAG: 7-carboxy-7-deazaguanine synthase QueE [Chitinophagaceae bacterium]|nr:7-carboxy-7-deazaguanine synthase QueE [Chitinophagaceae bacterium]
MTENFNKNSKQTLPVMEAFYTIQGEGFYQGHAAYFVRLGGCDVGCVWCDVKESWDAEAHPKLSIKEIVDEAKQFEGRLVVITGGEPLMHDTTALTNAFKDAGFATNIETSGSSPLSGEWDWICLSPKKFKEPLLEVCKKANELKIVVYNKSDFEWAEKYAALVPRNCQLYLQPEWSKIDSMIDGIISYIQQNPKWQLSLQLHKYIGVR